MSKKLLLIGITCTLFLASCATLIKGTDQTVTINSNVDGASIFLDGVKIGVTPFIGEIKKDKEALVIKKDGFKTYNLTLSKSLEPMFWGNIITGGTLGSITDFASGAAYSYSPSSYQVELFRVGEESTAYLKRFELRRYALLNITDISIDLGNNGGGYLETLISLADLPYNEKSISLVRTKFEKSRGNEIVFGKEIVKLLDA